ncbi:MAG: hypothetical protein ACOCQY_02665 [Halorhabdus sp.]
MASFLSELLNSGIDMPGKFLEVATQDPISAILVVFGAVFVGGAVLAGAYLGLGAVVDLLRPSRPAAVHRPRGR